MDMLVDGRRVYSFWLHRDGSRVGGGIGGRLQSRWRVPWPRTLQEFLDGTARFTVVVHETGEQVFDDEVTLGSGARADRDPQPQRTAAQPRQVLAPRRDLRHPQRREHRAPDARHRGRARGAGRRRDRGVPGLRHPARRRARGQAAGPRQRRRPRLREPPHPPGRRDPRVVPAPAGADRARLPDHPLLGTGVQGGRRRGRRRGAGARRLRRLPDGRPPAPDGRDPRCRSRSRGSSRSAPPPSRAAPSRRPRPRQAAHRDVRPVADAGPGLQVRAAGHDGAPPQRVVPRAARGPRALGPDLLAGAEGDPRAVAVHPLGGRHRGRASARTSTWAAAAAPMPGS